jgi:hypothetical protein
MGKKASSFTANRKIALSLTHSFAPPMFLPARKSQFTSCPTPLTLCSCAYTALSRGNRPQETRPPPHYNCDKLHRLHHPSCVGRYLGLERTTPSQKILVLPSSTLLRNVTRLFLLLSPSMYTDQANSVIMYVYQTKQSWLPLSSKK